MNEERLIGYAWTVRQSLVPRAGVPGKNGTEVELVPETTLVFVHPAKTHAVIIPLDDENRRKLVAGLTGGVVIPTP